MASNRMIRPVIVTCLLSVAALLGGCSPTLPKTLLLSSGGTMHDTPVPSAGVHAMSASPVPTSP